MTIHFDPGCRQPCAICAVLRLLSDEYNRQTMKRGRLLAEFPPVVADKLVAAIDQRLKRNQKVHEDFCEWLAKLMVTDGKSWADACPDLKRREPSQ